MDIVYNLLFFISYMKQMPPNSNKYIQLHVHNIFPISFEKRVKKPVINNPQIIITLLKKIYVNKVGFRLSFLKDPVAIRNIVIKMMAISNSDKIYFLLAKRYLISVNDIL